MIEDKRVTVVWGVDKKYVLQAFVVMRSILLHSREMYHFIILTSDCIDEYVSELDKILKREYGNFKVTVRFVDPSGLEGVRVYNKYLTKATYFRLFIPEILQEYDKCIYLDCDLIVHGDLAELYDIDLGDNYLAGVKDCHIIEDTQRGQEHQRITGLPARDKYINAGVLVMGLKRMRQEGILSRLKEQMRRENWYEDQDVLNVCCYPYIMILPLKYNLFHFYLGNNMKRLYHLPYDRQDFDFDHNWPYILHMGGKYKGWSFFGIKGSREWWKTAEVFSTSAVYQFYRSRCRDIYKDATIAEMINRARESKHIVIWGYSKIGKRLCDILLEYQLDNIGAFVDNDQEVWGESYRDVPVIGITSVDWEKNSILWIVSCQISYAEVTRQLMDQGIEENSIIRYWELFIDTQCLLLLHESTYDSMVSALAEREYVRKFPDRSDRERYIKNILNAPMRYDEEYAYLAEKYNFSYWLEIWHQERIGNEDNSYHGVPEQ